jgi:hypothetical protein
MPCWLMVVSKLGLIRASGLLIRLRAQGHTVRDTRRCIYENGEHCSSGIFGELTHGCTRMHSRIFFLGMQKAQ